VQVRLQHDCSYQPPNLKANAGVLPSGCSVVPVVTLPNAAAAAASGSNR
jgi:hypothetical protein